MVINVTVQYNSGFLPDILLLTQASIVVWFDDTIIPFRLTIYYLVFCFVLFGGLHGD